MDRRRRASNAYKSETQRGSGGATEEQSGASVSEEQSAGAAQERPRASGDNSVKDEQQGFAKTTATGDSSSRTSTDAVSEASVEPSGGEPSADLSRLLGKGSLDRAARLLIAMGTERAARVIAHLGQSEVEAVTRAIMQTERVSRGELSDSAEQSDGSVKLHGGPEMAREMLVKAFGEQEGERRFFVTVPNAPQRHFAFMNDLEPAQIHAALHDESPGVVALVIAHIDRQLAAGAFSSLPAGVQPVVARRIARMGHLSRSTVVQVEAALREKIRNIGTERTDQVGGTARLAAIIRHLPLADADEIVEELAGVDTEMASAIRRELLTVDVLETLRPRDLADLLREFDEQEIALLLKGKSEELRAAVLRSVSDRRATDISEAFAHLGPQTREDVDRVTYEVLERLREREADGSILVPRDGDRYI